MDPDLAQLAHDRYEIADALHRYAFGLDHNHADTLASVLTEDCRFDFSPAGRKLGLEFSSVTGREEILNKVLPLVGPLQTSHSATNIQIEVSGDTATLAAYMMSQHFMPLNDPERGREFALLMNRYDCELVRAAGPNTAAAEQDHRWRFKRITIDNAWFQGDPEILNASASYHALRQKRMRPKS
jgi:SnoaL-like domain